MTPIEEISLDLNNNKFYIKRDDLLPFAFGGNKVRIAKEFIDDMHEKKRDCLIGYGNARSNLSRAIANFCSKENIKCHIISPADDDGQRIETFNSLLVKKNSVVFHECLKSNVANTVEKVISQCREEGYNPYYIYGSKYGTGNEITPVRAYYKAYKEIRTQLSAMSIDVDYIFLATGTGMTQSGLIAGNRVNHGREKIIGISVARNRDKEESVIKAYLDSCKNEEEFEYGDNDVIVDDSYLCDGYGQYNSNISKTIDDMYLNHGIPLDPTYSGKAFTGMIDYIKKNQIANKSILFLHTGGIPLFFDYLRKNRSVIECTECNDYDSVLSFIANTESLLPVPLKQRVDLEDYVNKVMNNGTIISVKQSNRIVAAVLFYANNIHTKRAYITFIATLPEYEGHGYASCLIDSAEKYAVDNGMRVMSLETDFSNCNAIAFYTKRGYKVEYADQKLHMIKELL